MRKIWLCFYVACSMNVLTAQTVIHKSVMAPGDVSGISGQVEVISVAGEIFIREIPENSILVSEGFIAPDLTVYLKIRGYDSLTGVKVYPNPVSNRLRVNWGEQRKVRIYLIDIRGHIVDAWKMTGEKADLRVDELQAGVYFLFIIDDQSRLKSVLKIQKL